MKKNIIVIIILLSSLFSVLSAVNNHNEDIFYDWIYNDYNNEGEWQIIDLGDVSIAPSLSAKRAYVRISIEVDAIDTDGSEFVYLEVREYNGNYNSVFQTATSYNIGKKGELNCWTDTDAHIEIRITYGWWESKKVRVRVRLENSID